MSNTLSSTWQVQEAKSRFSELLQRVATDGPQLITRHGKPMARVVPVHPQEEGFASGTSSGDTDNARDFAEFLLSAPTIEGGLPEWPREEDVSRPPLFGDL